MTKNTFPLGKSVGKKEAQATAEKILGLSTDKRQSTVEVMNIAQDMGISIICHNL